jgi:acyl-CoA synthetase (AMP-forming)/AMP-acid ligase II
MFHSWMENQYGTFSAITDAITGHTISYYDLYNQCVALSNSLYRKGIRQGTLVALYAPNHILYPVAVYAISMLGAITVFISPAYTST